MPTKKPVFASQLNAGDLTGQMLAAAKNVFLRQWRVVGPYATTEFANFSQDLLLIEELTASGQMDQAHAAIHVEMQKNSMRAVMVALKGIGILTVEMAINAALSVVSETVNKSVGFGLL